MKFLVSYSFTSSQGLTFTGKAKIKAKDEEKARAIFKKQNRDCIITGVTQQKKKSSPDPRNLNEPTTN